MYRLRLINYGFSPKSRIFSSVESCVILNSFSHPGPSAFNPDNGSCQRRNNSSQPWSESIYYSMSTSRPVAIVQDFILKAHEISGLPWWATIVMTTFAMRTFVTFPLAVYQAYVMAKVENIQLLEMPSIAESKKLEIAKEARSLKLTERQATLKFRLSMKEEWTKLIIRDNCHPAKASLPIWFQIPTWVCLSTALRNLAYKMPHQDEAAEVTFLELSVGGFLWCPNLTAADPTFILPVLMGVSNLVIIEVQSMMRMREPTRGHKFATNFFRVLSVAIIPIAAVLPSCLSLYWTTSSVLGLGQNLILMSNKVRSTFQIPDTPSTVDHPYRMLALEISQKFKVKS